MAKSSNCVIPNGKKLRQKRLERGLTQEKLSFLAKVSKSSVERVEKSKPTQITTLKFIVEAIGGVDIKEILISRDQTFKIKNSNHSQNYHNDEMLIKIANALNISCKELLHEQKKIQNESLVDFEFLAEKFREIDHRLLPLIRDHHNASRHLIEYNYKSLLKHCLIEQNVELESIDMTLKDSTKRNVFLSNLPEPGLTVDVSSDFKEISYCCNSNEILIVKSPKLLWDCHCDTPSISQKKFNCPIHSKEIGDEVDRRFSTSFIVIEYMGNRFYWRNSPELWPPSTDSFNMIKAMEEDGLFEKKYNSILDIGSGTGFLGIIAACRNHYVTDLTLSDWLMTPYLYGATNWFLNRKKLENVRFKAHVGLFASDLDSQVKPFDIAICNPPYLPLLNGFGEIGLESTVAGTDLLQDVIMKNKLLAKRIYIQFSNLSQPEAKLAQEKAKIKLRPVGKEKLVPFRIRLLWDRNDYIDILKQDRGLIEIGDARHRFWHKLQTYVIE